MHSFRTTALVVLLSAIVAQACATGYTRYVELINRANGSVMSLAIADPGSGTFRDLPFDAPLPGGGHSTTLGIAGDRCLYDFRFVFRDGRTLIYKDVDVCRHHRLRIHRLPGKTGAEPVPASGRRRDR